MLVKIEGNPGSMVSPSELEFVTAARALGASDAKLILRHILPNTLAPLLVQATYICASAMITEAILSFIGAGTPPNIPSWGNIMAEGRVLPYLDIPFQHASPKILKLMKRPGNQEKTLERIKSWREICPNIPRARATATTRINPMAHARIHGSRFMQSSTVRWFCS